MEILSFQDAPSPKRKKSVRILLGISVLLGVGVFGSTLAANISINAGGAFQFGQGLVQATTCDAAITVTPASTFTNASGAGAFYFGQVSISNVDATACDGKTFTIKAYGDTGAALTLFSTTSAISFGWDGVAPYAATNQTSGATVTMATGTDAVVTWTSSLAATSVYKVTLETS